MKEKHKRIFLTGASGFIGREICSRLLDSQYEVTALLRKGSILPSILRDKESLKVHKGDITDPLSLRGALDNHDAVIHLVGIIREFPAKQITFQKMHVESTRNMIKIAESAGVKRFLHMSALGTRKNAKSRYHQTKWDAEMLLRNSKLDYTIFRPSIVFGRNDQFTNMIANIIRRFHLFPLIGGGKGKMQPIAIDDVAEGLIKALEWYPSVGRIYEIGGYEIYQFADLVKEIARACNTWCITPYAPISIMRTFARLFGNYSWFPITPSQIQMLTEDNTTDSQSFFEDFTIAPISFKKGIRSYL